ncbi:MAG: hypothetical protein ACXVLQ_01780 [Bacteriovorax sp.]
MKKLLILAFASILSGNNTYALEAGTNALAYTLAQTIYSTAIGVATSEATSLAISSGSQKAEALRIQNEAQNYFQSGKTSIYLESKIQLAKELNPRLSDDESIDLLLEASKIILSK